MQDNVEHVMSVIQRSHRFSEDDKVLNLDDILSFDELNELYLCTNTNKTQPSPFLVGPNRDILKIHIVIAPLCEFSSTDPPEKTLIMPSR